MNTVKTKKFFDILSEHIVPKSELNWHVPLDLVIAVVLSAQSTDKAVNKATKILWQHCRTADDYIALGAENLSIYLRTIGLYKNKANYIIGLCGLIRDKFHYNIPQTRNELESLPGVGRKTANVLLNTLYKQPTLAVDTHVFRVATRTGLADAKTPRGVEDILLTKVPQKHLLHAHHYLVLHGRYTCKARRPECWRCLVIPYCSYQDKRLSPPQKK